MADRFLAKTVLIAAALGVMPVYAACGPYSLGFYEFGVLYYKNAAGKFTGIDQDVVDEIARRTGCVFASRVASRARIWAELADGRLDISVSAVETPERTRFLHFVNYVHTRNYLIVRKELGERAMSLRAFAADPSLRVGVVRSFKYGTEYDRWLDELRAQQRVDEYFDNDAVARAFVRAQVQGFLSHPLAWGELLKRHDLENAVRKLDVAPQSPANAGMVLSKQRVKDKDVATIREAMAQMRRDGTLMRIFARHLDQATAEELARDIR